jgi:hypothetical protein
MAQHGYLHGMYDNDDFGRGDDRARGSDRGSWRGDDWRDERGRGFMFDERDGDRGGDREHSAFSSPSPEHARDRFRLDDRHSGRDQWQGSGGRFSSSTHDHYRSWRDRQMQELDRDYEEYCREREQQFHQDFDSWRRDRQSQGGSQSGQQGQSSEEVMDLDNPVSDGMVESQGATTSPMGTATLGTNNADNTLSAPNATGRGSR